MSTEPSPSHYLALAPGCSLKRLESPYLYSAATDDLYELNIEAMGCLEGCDGTRTLAELAPEAEFLDFCLEEGLLELLPSPEPRPLPEALQSPLPSLRYLEVQLTRRCNLRCRHCYLGEAVATDLPLEDALAALSQLERMGGLRAMLSGGEPLAWPHFAALNDRLPDFALRPVLLTNATLLTPELARGLKVREVQVSLDGLEAGHDSLRGAGNFRRALAGLAAAREAGLAVSVATMLHPAALPEMEGLARLVAEFEACEWGIDVPARSGRYAAEPALWLTPEEAAPHLALAFGGAYHGGQGGPGDGSGEGGKDGGGFACGLHLATLDSRGQLLKCGFYPEPLGHLTEGLRECWQRLKPVPLAALECRGCEQIGECGGGCRFRAGSPLARDPYMCALRGVKLPT